MNRINMIDTSYIRSDRSIEMIQIENLKDKPICFVYNFEGVHYRFFENIISLLNFFEFEKEPKYDFETETELDNFLENLSYEKNPLLSSPFITFLPNNNP